MTLGQRGLGSDGSEGVLNEGSDGEAPVMLEL